MVQQPKASYSWVFARKGLSPKDGRGLLQLRIYLNRKKQKYISTKEHLTQEDWDLIEAALKDSKKEKHLSKNLLTKLHLLKSFRHEIEAFETSQIYQDKSLTFDLLDAFLRKTGPQSFNEFIKQQLDADMSLKASTKRPHQNTLNKLNEFRSRIEFNQINYTLIEGFDNFLRKKGLNLNSIEGHHKRLGKYISIAINKDLIEKNPYKKTVLLPTTDFSMKANGPVREPERIQSWAEERLYERILEKNKGRPTFVMHDGPPYANGHLHMGHTLNKILKDFVSRYRNMDGHLCDYVPGWDCHGLPIELQSDKELGAKKKDIVYQFLIESSILSATGGLIGVALGLLIPWLVSRFAGMQTIVTAWSLALAFSISVAIGVVFGLYPARSAAELDPITALHHE